jgi:hypothetical protein
MASRVFIVFLCYIISAAAFILSMAFSIFIPIPIAWICHFLICIQWIIDQKINEKLIQIFIFCGILSFLFMPIFGLVTGNINLESFGISLVILFSEFLFTSPCLILIIYIIKQNSVDENEKITF